MHIGLVGFRNEVPGFESLKFSSDRSFLDFDLIIWNPDYLGVSEYGMSPEAKDTRKLLLDYDRRYRELRELMKMGRTMFVLMPAPDYVCRASNFFSKLGIPDTVPGTGKQIEFRGEPIYSPFFEANKAQFEFRSAFDQKVGSPFLFIKDSSRAVGTHVRIDDGHLLLVPALAGQGSATITRTILEKFISSAVALRNSINAANGRDEEPLPPWSNEIRMPGETALEEELVSLERDRQQLDEQIATKKLTLVDQQELKALLAGKGARLLRAVIRVLKELGVEAEEGPPGRDDIVGRFGGHELVFEVKGKKGSAAESDCMQLEKWRIRFSEENGNRVPKGVLVVNAFAETPVSQRREQAFPNQMLKIATGREHCLVTSAQLLAIYFQVKADPSCAQSTLAELFETVGIYSKIPGYGTQG